MRNLKDAFDLLLKIQSAKSKNTYQQSIQICKHLEWFYNLPLNGFETDFEEEWAAYVAHQKDQAAKENKKPRKLGHDRRYLVQALKRATNKGWIKKAFKKTDFSLLESTEPIGKHVSDEDMQKLLNCLVNHEKTWFQVMIAYKMGMRISEILQLRKSEVDLQACEINLDSTRLKTRKPRKVPIPIVPSLIPLFKKYYSMSQTYIFPSTTKTSVNHNKPQSDNSYWWDKARRNAGVRCRFHDLRHSAISNSLARGLQPLDACNIFGATMEVIQRCYHHIRKADRQKHIDILEG